MTKTERLARAVDSAIRAQKSSAAADAAFQFQAWASRRLPKTERKNFGIQMMAVHAALQMEIWDVAARDFEAARRMVCPYSAEVTVEWDNEAHTLSISARNWAKIKRGRPVRLRGKGYRYEGKFFWDYWSFNTKAKSSLVVTYGDEGGEGFVGSLKDATRIDEEFGFQSRKPTGTSTKQKPAPVSMPPIIHGNDNLQAEQDEFDAAMAAKTPEQKAAMLAGLGTLIAEKKRQS